MHLIDSKTGFAPSFLAFSMVFLMMAAPVAAQGEEPSATCQKIMTTRPWMRAQLEEDLKNDYGEAVAGAMMAWYEAGGSLNTAYSTLVSEVEEEQKAYTDGVTECIEELMPTCDETLASFEESGVPDNYSDQVDRERYKAQSCIFDVEASVKGE